MIFTFYRAQGHTELGGSLVEDEFLDTAKTIFEKAEEKNVNIMLPKDIVLGDAFDADANSKTIPVGEPIPENWMGLDIGPESIENFVAVWQTRKQLFGTDLWGYSSLTSFRRAHMQWRTHLRV